MFDAGSQHLCLVCICIIPRNTKLTNDQSLSTVSPPCLDVHYIQYLYIEASEIQKYQVDLSGGLSLVVTKPLSSPMTPLPPTCFPGHYMYIEASHMIPGHSARLLTTELRGVDSPQCLIFYYHMYGSGTGTLSVFLRRHDNRHRYLDLRYRDSLLWRRQGEQSISWMRAMVDYSCYTKHQVKTTAKLCSFSRIRGLYYKTDSG